MGQSLIHTHHNWGWLCNNRQPDNNHPLPGLLHPHILVLWGQGQKSGGIWNSLAREGHLKLTSALSISFLSASALRVLLSHCLCTSKPFSVFGAPYLWWGLLLHALSIQELLERKPVPSHSVNPKWELKLKSVGNRDARNEKLQIASPVFCRLYWICERTSLLSVSHT